jgi:hypothetical protein
MTAFVDEPREEWRPVSISPRYLVSDLGRVRGPRGRILRGNAINDGYLLVKIYTTNGASKTCLIHRLVAAAFLGQAPDGQQVNHLDGDTSSNRLSNLEYVTPSENMQHSYRTLNRRGARGSRFGRSALDERQVVEMRVRFALGDITTVQLGREFGVSTSTAGRIVRRKTWKHAEIDVVDRRRDAAIAAGAKAIDIREMGALVSARRPQFRGGVA